MRFKFHRGFFADVEITEDEKWIMKISRNGKILIDTPPCDTFHDAIMMVATAAAFALALKQLDSVKEYNAEVK